MNARAWIPVAVFLVGIACVATAVATGEAEVDLFIVFPVFSGSGALFLLGVILTVLSFIIGFAVFATTEADAARTLTGPETSERLPAEKKSHYGGVVLIGPVPIAFGSDKRVAIVMLVIGIATAIVLFSILLMLG